jgi:general L-amino acid transport system substrate-binding protein
MRLAFLLLAALVCPVGGAQTLENIRHTQTLRCGIDAATPEYSTSDDHGPRIAFDTRICKAVAVAILGPNARVVLTQFPDDATVLAALKAGSVDLVPTLTLDLTHSPGVAFSPPILQDGVGFLVPTVAHLTRAEDLDNKKICFLAETEVEVATRAWFARRHLRFLPFPFQEAGEMNAAFVTNNCTALAGDLTQLAAARLSFGPLASRYTLLPGQISSDPMASASVATDPAFARIVFWVAQVLLQAEESGLTQHTASLPASKTDDPTLARLLGQTREIGTLLNLDNAWAVHVIAAVGNYAELYDRTLGSSSPTQLPRAQNRLTTDGGLLYPLPIK